MISEQRELFKREKKELQALNFGSYLLPFLERAQEKRNIPNDVMIETLYQLAKAWK